MCVYINSGEIHRLVNCIYKVIIKLTSMVPIHLSQSVPIHLSTKLLNGWSGCSIYHCSWYLNTYSNQDFQCEFSSHTGFYLWKIDAIQSLFQQVVNLCTCKIFQSINIHIVWSFDIIKSFSLHISFLFCFFHLLLFHANIFFLSFYF